MKREERELPLRREEAERPEREREVERRKEIELEKLRIQASFVKVDLEASLTGGTEARAKLPKLLTFANGKDDLDSWLTRFERFTAM
ncbi:hypothetical protein PoB_005543300 [Plakobranchus ocellatus]|uniref:Uncharacterized protein n=1 Tax=Plakobranchus ocellatus TaxID=259542 RepID=A0AAV4CAM7_9GAST|nr:hypothetical protein PoB_005543300 [Plakobranchus ocellatus]